MSRTAHEPRYDPYAGNPLVQRLGPILQAEEVLKRLRCVPAMPRGMIDAPKEARLHGLANLLRTFHIPLMEELRLYQTIDLMLRPGYRSRHPGLPATWQRLDSGDMFCSEPLSPPIAAFVEGPSGAGKSQAIAHCLSLFPQLVRHHSFPMCKNGLNQLVWLTTHTPGSGTTRDLGTAMKDSLERILGSERFEHWRPHVTRHGRSGFEECCQIVATSFLGILHIDDVESFFKIPPLRERQRSRGTTASSSRELRVVEDQCLKNIHYFINTSRIPLLLSGTNDGAAALQRRFSNAQRLAVAGYHRFHPFPSADHAPFRDVFLPALARYQCVQTPLAIDDALANLLHELTAGIPRLLVAIWFHAHRVAFERKGDDSLRLEDFKTAAATYMAPVADAVQALHSRSPDALARYEDLLPRDERHWNAFWAASA